MDSNVEAICIGLAPDLFQSPLATCCLLGETSKSHVFSFARRQHALKVFVR